MLIDRLWSLLPSRRTFLTVALSSTVGAALAIGGLAWLRAPNGPAPGPQPAHNPRFVTLGKAYLPQLGKAYAAAWEEGAKQLDAGQGVAAALDAVSKTWLSNRSQLYDHLVTPEFSKIIAESVKDADVTPQERAAMSAAWRGFALGLEK